MILTLDVQLDAGMMRAQVRGDNRHVRLPTGGHQTYVDLGESLEDMSGMIPIEEGWRITRIYALAFLRYHLGGDPRADELAAVLDGSLQVDDGAELVP